MSVFTIWNSKVCISFIRSTNSSIVSSSRSNSGNFVPKRFMSKGKGATTQNRKLF